MCEGKKSSVEFEMSCPITRKYQGSVLQTNPISSVFRGILQNFQKKEAFYSGLHRDAPLIFEYTCTIVM